MSYLLKTFKKCVSSTNFVKKHKYYKNIILIISLSLEELYNLLQIEEQASDITVKTDKGIGVGSKLFFFLSDELAPLRRTLMSIASYI